ncbi:diguanylate cyclase [Burkholderia humptydooensis]|uniref:Diguanylate cyclase n=2 Tax=Burkholderia humptydooensis TaxID=430531 RepID=A0A7U4STL3_9BURK|nr:diguanylate cyclase domain protein [Burkholderia sp. 2002721687]ALX44886.1 diguanylate cyclase [Burkholderia humptydooensis]EIP84498.1 diguanylate cyclase/phosphodiesterase [Burkholderia humptydooensis MSMB43]QPS46338.1 diguanylate cyclase [Burkholderia humptydooensis]
MNRGQVPGTGAPDAFARRYISTRHRILTVGALLCVLTSVSILLAAANEWRNTYASAYRTAQVIAKSYAVHLAKVFATTDALTGVIRYEYDRSPETFHLRSLIDGSALTFDSAAQITIVGADGLVLQTWPHKINNSIYLNDRPHFIFHKNNSATGFFIGAPVKGRVSGYVTIQFTRRLVGRAGKFAGVVVTSERPEFLSAGFLSRASVGEHGALLAFLNDGVLLSRAELNVQATATGPGLNAYLEASGTSSGELVDPIDRSTRIFARAPVDGYPVVAAVALSKAEAMAPFRAHLYVYVVFALVVLGILLGATVLALRHARKLILAEEEMRKLASTDPLTDLENRRSLRAAIDTHCSRVPVAANSLALLTLDLREFGRVNDLLGQDAGDALLRLVADRLRGIAATDVRVARVGGDEFSLLVDDKDALARALGVARIVVEAFERAFGLRGHAYLMKVAIGIATLERSVAAGSELWRNANRAMSDAKRAAASSGESEVRIYSEAMAHQLDRDDDDFRALLLAMERREIRLHYEPIVDISTGRLSAWCGSLVWERASDDVRTMSELHGLANRTDLSFRLGTYQLAEAYSRQDSACAPIYSAIPAAVALQGDLDNFIEHLEETRGIRRRNIRLGILNAGELIGHQRTVESLRRLHSQGAEIFAAGITGDDWSISIVRLLPLTGVEIGSRFLSAASQDKVAESMLLGIMTTCSELSLRIQVSGLDSQQQCDFLRSFSNVLAYGKLYPAAVFNDFADNPMESRGHDS